MVNSYIPSDPYLSSQWHLGLIGRLGQTSSFNLLGLERIWADYTGAGIHVGIWDDGVERTHWDLSANYDETRQVTIGGTLNDGQPIGTSSHGTSVAGLIAAANNGQGGVGVAFGASITGITIFDGPDDINSQWGRYLQTLDSLGNFDVTNHSYGAPPDFAVWGDVAKFGAAAQNGRGGLGTINVKSAGNDNIDGNGDALDGSRFTVTVAATNSGGQVTSYSTYGAHVLVAAPAGSVTTDRLGLSEGYNGTIDQTGDYTDQFGGTSAAGPITAGVVTLMLDANAGLGWRDVQNILSYSAIGAGSLYGGATTNENFAWKWTGAADWNGGGLHYSEDYGYGVVNAFNAVRMAEVWSVLSPTAATSANELHITTGTLSAQRPIADESTINYSFTVSQNISLEHVELTVNLTHSWLPDLRLRLISPDGTVMSLYDGSSGDGTTADNGLIYAFSADGLRGERSAGTWTLQVQDAARNDVGTLNSVAFDGFGSAVVTNNVYHYTDEVLRVLSQTGQSARMTLTDSNGGVDWIDAAAMFRDVVLNLAAGSSSTLAGTAFLAIAAGTLIENAITGDGNDVINGNGLDNTLVGMRGDDTLDGGGGTDTALFFGNSTDYQITANAGVTTVTHLAGTFGTDVLTHFEFLKFDDTTIADPSAGTSPADTTAPVLVSTLPVDNAKLVAVDATIQLSFNENIALGSSGTIEIYTGAGVLWQSIDVTNPGGSLSLSGNVLTIDPSASFAKGGSYYVLISSGALTDTSGNGFDGISNPLTLNFDVVPAVMTFTGTVGANTLVGTSGDDELYGLAGNDNLSGLAGNDLLDGGSGNDTMAGGLGDDIYIVDNSRDRVTELSNAGTDTVKTTLLSYILGSNLENLVYTGPSNFRGDGNAANNTLTGANGNDVLNGLAGADVLQGNGGNDSLRGGLGQDHLFGGLGADRFIFGSTTEAGLGSTMDVIEDFAPGDKIDLSLIDANTSSRLDQAFSAIFVQDFTGLRGQLRLTAEGADLIVAGDVNGDRVADFQIHVTGVQSLTSGDFIL